MYHRYTQTNTFYAGFENHLIVLCRPSICSSVRVFHLSLLFIWRHFHGKKQSQMMESNYGEMEWRWYYWSYHRRKNSYQQNQYFKRDASCIAWRGLTSYSLLNSYWHCIYWRFCVNDEVRLSQVVYQATDYSFSTSLSTVCFSLRIRGFAGIACKVGQWSVAQSSTPCGSISL